jgi:hypothetical protein
MRSGRTFIDVVAHHTVAGETVLAGTAETIDFVAAVGVR